MPKACKRHAKACKRHAKACKRNIREHAKHSPEATVLGEVEAAGFYSVFQSKFAMGALSGVEMGLDVCGVPHRRGGVIAALDLLATTSDARGDA